jgi:glycosyltransferase involved in cell wall biosynthesis
MKDMWYAAEKDKMSIRSLQQSDFVTTTGRKLQQTFRNFNKNVVIYRNMFDWAQPQWHLPRDRKDDTILIGWVGLTSHYEDIRKMHPILKYIHDKYPNTRFVLSGMAIKDTEVNITIDEKGGKKFEEKEITEESRTYRYKVRQMYNDFDTNRIEYHNAIELEQYGDFYKNLDIGLAYLENLTFNACKSEIKVVEYMKYGVVPIWMNIGGYKDMHEAMPAELKAAVHPLAIETENPQRWQEALEDAVVNIEKWRKVAQDCKLWVEEQYDVNRQVHDRVDFYTQIIEDHLEKEVNRIQAILA